MDIDPNAVAAMSGVFGAIIGVVGASFQRGKSEGVLSGKIDALSIKVDYMNDELARRITVLENRVQYDGYYTNPRVARHDNG